MSTYKFINPASSEMAALDSGRPQRFGLDFWLALLVAFLSVGLSSWVWVNNEDIIAWGLSHGIVDEGATRRLLGAVRHAAIVGAVLGLGAAGLTVRPIRLRVITVLGDLGRTVTAAAQAAATPLGYLWRGISDVAEAIAFVLTAIWLGAAAVARAVTLALVSLGRGVASVLVLGAFVIAMVMSLALGYLRRGAGAGLGYIRMGIVPVAAAMVVVLTAIWLGAAAVARAVILALVSLGRGVASVLVLVAFVIAMVVSLALGYLGRGAGAGVGYIRMGIVPVAASVAIVLTAMQVGAAAVARVAIHALVTLRLGVLTALVLSAFVIAKVLSLALGYLGRAAGAGLGYIRVVIVPIAEAIALALTGIWRGAAAVARAVTLALVSLGSGVASALVLGAFVIGMVASLAVGYLRRGAGAGVVYIRMGIAPVGAAMAVVLTAMRVGAAAVARAVTLALVSLGRGVASALVLGAFVIGMVASLAVGYLRRGAGAGLGYIRMGLVSVAAAMAVVLTAMRLGAAAVARVAIHALVRLTLGVLTVLVLSAFVIAMVVSLAIGYLRRVAGAGVGYIRMGLVPVAAAMAVVLTAMRVGAAAVARAVTLALVSLGRGVAIALVLSAFVIAKVVSLALGYLGRGAGAGVGYVRMGLSPVSTAVALVLTAILLGAAFVVRYLHFGASTVFGYVGIGASTTAQLALLAMSSLWLTISAVLGAAYSSIRRGLVYLGLGVAALAQLATQVAGYAWMPISVVLIHLGIGIAAIGRAAVGILKLGGSTLGRPLGVGTMIILRQIWLGLSTTALTVGWTAAGLTKGTVILLESLIKTPGFLLRTVWTGFTVSPDVSRAIVWSIRREKGGTTMSDFNLTRERLLPLVVTVLVFFTIGSVAVRVLWPAPPEPTVEVVHWATGHLFRDDLLPNMAAEFNQRGHRSESGKRIVVKVVNDPSSLQAEDLLSRVTGGGRLEAVCCPASDTPHPDPTIVTPSSAHWLVRVNHEARRKVVDPGTARSIARAYIGIVTYRAMAECLGWPDKQIGYADIIELRRDPMGWRKYDCAKPSWGTRPLVAFTDPRTSSTGRSVLLAFYSIAAGKQPENLTSTDVIDPKVVGSVKEFQGLIDHYFIGTTVMNTKIYQGPRFGQFFLMPEDNLIHLYEGTERAFFGGKKRKAPRISRPMVMIYPKEGSMARNNCACIVNAPWVTAEHVKGAEKWIDFIREDKQQRAFMRAGFRPVTDLPLTDPHSKINSNFGLTPSTPAKVMDVALIDPAVADAIDKSWETVKRPGIVTFVVDTSGSMLGGKLRQAKQGLIRALDSMAENNQVGFLSFGDSINTRIPVAPLADSGSAIADAVDKLRARGETALYDAIKTGIEMTDAAEGDPGAIRGVVVLTDGWANRCRTRLHDLIRMESRKETPIRVFGGCENDPPAVDAVGRRVEKIDMIGVELGIETRHPIQIFFIGIGEDADMEVGRMLAESTGAEFQGVSEDDLANVLAEFSGYF